MAFGKRLAIGTLFGTALGAIMYVVGQSASTLAILPGMTGPVMALIGFTCAVAISIYDDIKEQIK